MGKNSYKLFLPWLLETRTILQNGFVGIFLSPNVAALVTNEITLLRFSLDNTRNFWDQFMRSVSVVDV